jgi:hypothetical protein
MTLHQDLNGLLRLSGVTASLPSVTGAASGTLVCRRRLELCQLPRHLRRGEYRHLCRRRGRFRDASAGAGPYAIIAICRGQKVRTHPPSAPRPDACKNG